MTTLAPDLEGVQRRTVRVLMLTQTMGAGGIMIGVATAPLLARDLSGSEALAGLAQTAQVLGTAVVSFLLAPVMARRGRRVGLCTGYVVGAAGALLAVVAGVVGSMALLLVGAALLGATSSANNAARYAATDLATAASRGRSLSLVVWATTIGAVVGPNLTGPAGGFADLAGIPELTGPFALGAVGMVLAGVTAALLLRPDPLVLAQEAAIAADDMVAGPPLGTAWSRALAAVRERPVLGYAVAGLALAHATMIGVMVMTPLHMEHGGAGIEVIGIVISVHVLGMYAFSPVAGWLADRFGRPQVMGAGGAVLLAALVVCAASPAGMSWQVTAGLFLLGLGWSLAMVAASTMVSEHAPIEARTDVQGSADLVMGLAGAAAGALSGLVVGLSGYPALALLSLALVAGVLAAAARAGVETLGRPTRRTA
ncbi:MAG TPA: MFS transporter [Nocardioides sp.]|nr:MFS transporter [Nocardioides sp.]